MKSSFKLKLKPSKAIPILRSFFKQKFANGSIFFKEKIFPTIKPKKIHKKADEINIFIEDKKWLNKMEKKTKERTSFNLFSHHSKWGNYFLSLFTLL